MWLAYNTALGELFFINHVIIAILLGLLIKNLARSSIVLDAGITFAVKICLYIGIVLLGATLNLGEIFQVGANALVMVVISITMCVLIGGLLGRLLFNNSRWGHLVGAGIGICGISAVMALAPAIRAREREILAAIGAAIVTDLLVLVVLPSTGYYLGWSESLGGYLAGVVPANTAQSIAIGYTYSELSGVIATIVKSARNAFIPVVVLLMTYFYTRQGLPVGEKVTPKLLWDKFPKFIVGLVAAAVLSTMGLISSEGIYLSGELSRWFFVTCFVGIGASIDLRALGGRDLAAISLGPVLAVFVALYLLLYNHLFLQL